MGNGLSVVVAKITVCGGHPLKDILLSGKGAIPLPHLLGEET
jgi:hypothetical protein